MRRKILVTGGTGQLGVELLRRRWSPDFEVRSPPRNSLDLTDRDSIRAAIESEPWACVVNAAAYTDVDLAEMNAGDAFRTNCQGPAWLAEATADAEIPLVHISTDYVFSGQAGRPYVEEDPLDPINAYGASKAEGELAIRAANPRSVIVRTAWLLSPHRSNFLKTMLRLAAGQPSLRVVSDQRGSPTSANDLADAVSAIASRLAEDDQAPCGIYHFVNFGDASRYELAAEILRQSDALGGPGAQVEPVASNEFATPARRPADSRLSAEKIGRDFGIHPRNWRDAVADIMAELDESGELGKLGR